MSAQIFRSMWRWAHLILLLLPVYAWQATIYTLPFYASITAVADRDGCVFVGDGHVLSAHVILDGNSFPATPPYICLPSGAALHMDVVGPTILISFPPGEIKVNGDPLAIYSANSGVVAIEWPSVIYLLLGVGALLLFYAYLSRRLMYPRDLKDVEKSVYRYILEHPGCTQKEISQALQLEKYKVSRILKRLEENGYIWRKRFGVSKRVYPQELQ